MVLKRGRLFEQYRLPRKHYPSAELVKKCIKNLLVSHFLIPRVSFYLVGVVWSAAAGEEMGGAQV